MIRNLSLSLAATGLAAASSLALVAGPELPAPGSEAPALETGTWFNHLGRNPDWNSLRGKAVMIEFWATW